MTADLLALQNVSLRLGRSPRFLLKDISFELQAGEVIALLGNRGSGKTLLMQLLNGLKSPSQGQVQWSGQALTKTHPVTLRRQIAWLPQQPRLLGMTGKEAIAYPLQLQGLNNSEIQQRLETWLNILQIPLPWLERREDKLSQPAAQAIALVRALVTQPQLLLLDDPWPQQTLNTAFNDATATSQQDESSALPAWENPIEKIALALAKFSQSGGTVLWGMTEQSRTAAEETSLAQRLLCLVQGQLIANNVATPSTWQQAVTDLAEASSNHSPTSEEEAWD